MFFKYVEEKYYCPWIDWRFYEFILKIKTAMDKNGPLKTIKQMKDKLWNLWLSWKSKGKQ